MDVAFKRWCENEAVNWRRKLDLYAHEALPAAKLAAALKVLLITPTEIPGFDATHLMNILEVDNNSWSAVAIPVPDRESLIVYNPFHSPARHESNIMHELAHLILDHEPVAIQTDSAILRQTYSKKDEDEAAYLGGCLQITRIGLDWAIGRKMSHQEIADHFGASSQMVRYRLNMTGRLRFAIK